MKLRTAAIMTTILTIWVTGIVVMWLFFGITLGSNAYWTFVWIPTVFVIAFPVALMFILMDL